MWPHRTKEGWSTNTSCVTDRSFDVSITGGAVINKRMRFLQGDILQQRVDIHHSKLTAMWNNKIQNHTTIVRGSISTKSGMKQMKTPNKWRKSQLAQQSQVAKNNSAETS